MAALQEGDTCPVPDCTGELVLLPDGDCRCHISPPCNACTNAKLVCVACCEVAGEPAA